MNARPDARSLIASAVDPGSWCPWDTPPADPAELGSAYREELAEARRRTGYDEAIVTGEGRLDGRRVAITAGEFSFLGGSIGRAAADRLVDAVRRATRERLPLLAAPASGGTRMQEGAAAFARMVTISAAVARHRAAGLPYLVYLRHPTTGGVFASWGSLGHLVAAEPGALIGFLGPRVYEQLYGEPFPAGVQCAENLYAHGLIDAVVGAEEIGPIAARALDVLTGRPASAGRLPSVTEDEPEDESDGASGDAWTSVRRSRRPERPGVRTLLRLGAHTVTPLSGTGEGERDRALLLALARFGDVPCVVLGQDRQGQRDTRPLGPAGLRVARRGMRLAAELRLPLVNIVDTPGAALSPEAEQSGLAAEIANCLADLAQLPTPILCLLFGEGAGGAALALLPADRALCTRHGWLSPLPPEGASAILYRTTERAAELAERQRIRSADLLRDGIVDRIIPEYPDAADEPQAFCLRVAAVLEHELAALCAHDEDTRLAARTRRFDAFGRR